MFDTAMPCASQYVLSTQSVPVAATAISRRPGNCWSTAAGIGTLLRIATDAPFSRATILPPGTARVAVEAALRFGWDRYLGERGGFVGMTGYGASGPADALYELFGITPAAIVAEAKRCLGR